MNKPASNLVFTLTPELSIEEIAASHTGGKIFIITDTNCLELCVRPLLDKTPSLRKARVIVTEPGDDNKNLTSLTHIWSELQSGGATRNSLVINIGGGVVTDMGGFAAATFKRGVAMVNVPTTLLSAVDAAVGGKTGINFNGFKNELGSFYPAREVVISTCWFGTLPHEELLSGYAEMLKHGLLEGRAEVDMLLDYDIAEADGAKLLPLLQKSVEVKRRVVEEDPYEHGIRKALNLGHTAGHAFESLALNAGSPVPHGYAVAWGLVVDLILSHMQLGFDSSMIHRVASFVKANYGAPAISCDDYPEIIRLMSHDKKNITPDRIVFTLLSEPGKVEINRVATEDEIKSALDIMRDLLGC